MSRKSKYTVDETYYEFDKELGIFSKEIGRYLKGYAQTEDDYLKVSLKAVGEKHTKTFLYHKVLWEHFNGEVPNGFELNHIDEDKHNFKMSNLELLTHSQNINYGTRNERVGKKNSISLKGRNLSEETKRKISEKNKGRKLSEDVKKLISKLSSKRVDQIDPITGDVLYQWQSATEAAKKLGFNHSLISACCKGERKTHMMYLWKRPIMEK